ncbi:folate-binding protein YgfZ [Methylicorpusculum sp.]|uniref:CAF17-like 4Fe-4S cluster assembly/insertion protein YgfZ n=1 Tax=Methylicorpusculum sp. TaxID=2713644 RepID=UPI0027284251|nr:folate-binding protein [Methylicorpusculum sp.]MDO8846543.1 folate-binding protein [Methylicorpusculum sp.]
MTTNFPNRLSHLGILTLTGKDAGRFIQGQVTCNINDITEEKGSLGALCNVKGRVISTFIVIKHHESYKLILPRTLLDVVKTTLQRYVLRSDVKLIDSSESDCLAGLMLNRNAPELNLPEPDFGVFLTPVYGLKLPSPAFRFLVILSAEESSDRLASISGSDKPFRTITSEEWQLLDLNAGIPWLDETTSEEFIPQMLNLDKLGGISFNKGCYTGQEIVARTHFLGKAKRELYLAEADCETAPLPNTEVSDNKGETVGKVLQAFFNGKNCSLQVVLPTTESTSDALQVKSARLQLRNYL